MVFRGNKKNKVQSNLKKLQQIQLAASSIVGNEKKGIENPIMQWSITDPAKHCGSKVCQKWVSKVQNMFN